MKTSAHSSPQKAAIHLPILDEDKGYWLIRADDHLTKLELHEYPKVVSRFKRKFTKSLFRNTKFATRKIKDRVIDSAVIGFDRKVGNVDAISKLAEGMYVKAYPAPEPDHSLYFGKYSADKNLPEPVQPKEEVTPVPVKEAKK